MTTKHLSLASVVRNHVEAYQRLAWFIVESIEREHLITLRAFWATLGARDFEVPGRRPARQRAPHGAGIARASPE
jgi:hypothetical protein